MGADTFLKRQKRTGLRRLGRQDGPGAFLMEGGADLLEKIDHLLDLQRRGDGGSPGFRRKAEDQRLEYFDMVLGQVRDKRLLGHTVRADRMAQTPVRQGRQDLERTHLAEDVLQGPHAFPKGFRTEVSAIQTFGHHGLQVICGQKRIAERRRRGPSASPPPADHRNTRLSPPRRRRCRDSSRDEPPSHSRR
ncbi:hypothetical protein D3C80_1210510 [compost metagenome]